MKKLTFAFTLCCALLSGCAQQTVAPHISTPAGSPEALNARLTDIDKLRIEKPYDTSLRAEYNAITVQLAEHYMQRADEASHRNDFNQATMLWHSALLYQPGNMRAKQNINKMNARRALDQMFREAEQKSTQDPELALRKVQQVLEEDPNWPQARALQDHLLREIAVLNQPENRLHRDLQKPVSLNFREHNLMAIFNVISQVTGVNIIFDKDVNSQATASLIAKHTTAEDAINVLLLSNNLRKKVLNANTVLLYPATAQKEKVYRDIVVKTVFLGYAKAKEVNVALRNMVKLKDVHVDERTNSITVRGPKESVEKAERILVTLDRPVAEVTLAVEVLEVNSSDVEALGLNLPERITAGFASNDKEGSNGNLPLNAFRKSNAFINMGEMSLDMKKVLSNAKVLANPRIRVKNNTKALVDIGETIPVLTATKGDGYSNQTVEYQDVGLKLEVTPDISIDDTISMDVKFNLSTLGVAETGENNVKYYRTNKREANTVLSSRNGETQMLAGLIKQDENTVDSGMPFLSKIPGLGRLFGSQSESKQRSEVILLITPSIDRNIDLPGTHISTIDMGTDELTGESLQLRGTGDQNVAPTFSLPEIAPPAQFPARNTALPAPVLSEPSTASGAE